MYDKWRNTILPGLIIAAGVVVVLLIGWFLMTDDPIAAAQPAFDHSNCQYPMRLSNPADGCDNSDPARPECMKYGTEDCALPKQDESIPISSAIVAPAPSHEVVSAPTPVKKGCYE